MTRQISTDFEFSRDDIDNLAQTLASLRAQFSDPEWALLLAVFTAASDRVTVRIPPKASATPETQETLKAQILDAFIPIEDNEDDYFAIGTEEFPDRIGSEPIHHPPPGGGGGSTSGEGGTSSTSGGDGTSSTSDGGSTSSPSGGGGGGSPS